MDSLGRLTDVSGWYRFFGPDEIHRNKSLWGTQLAASGADQFSTCAACCRGRDHGAGAVPNSIPQYSSDAAPATLRSDRRRALSSDLAAARPGRSDHLDTGAFGATVCERPSVALFDLHHSYRVGLYSHRHQFRSKTLSATTDHRLHSSCYRQPGVGVG